jgi:glucose/arabinose dehydrogenase
VAIAAAILWALACAPGAGAAAPAAPAITEPATDGQLVHPADVHMEVTSPANPDDDACTDWEIRTPDLSKLVWAASCKTGVLGVHIHLGDGTFFGANATSKQLDFNSRYVLRARFHASDGSVGEWAERKFGTYPASSPGGGIPWTPLVRGYVIDRIAGGLQLPLDIAFVPNPGGGPKDPLLYVTELYGTIKVITNDGTVGDYATGLLNYNPTGEFPGSGTGGLAGVTVDPGTGDVFAGMLYDPTVSNPTDEVHYPKVVRLHSTDGGQTAATRTTILDMYGENQPSSHQVSNLSIGPDGKLYVHMGDGFDPSTATNLDSFRGKILRINVDGSPAQDNPFYDASDGINARDYVYAYGFRNPFGGAWRDANDAHYEVENGPKVDRLARVDEGVNYTYDGTDASMAFGALYNWSPAHAPVNIAFVQPDAFGGSGFPALQQDHAFVAESGPTWAAGPEVLGKRIVEFGLDPDLGDVGGHPQTLVEYTGTGRATAAGVAAGPGGVYFTELYRDQGALTAIDPGARLLRVRYGPPKRPILTGTKPLSPSDENSPRVVGSAQFASMVTLYTDPGCTKAVASGSSDALESSGIPVPVRDNSSIELYADDRVAGVSSPCSAGPLTYTESSPPVPAGAAAMGFNLKQALRRCKKRFRHRKKKRARCVRHAKWHARKARALGG